MSADVIVTVGLIFDIIGVVLLIKFGLTLENMQDRVTGWADDGHDPEKHKIKRSRARFWGPLALPSLVFGFFLQIIAQWVA